MWKLHDATILLKKRKPRNDSNQLLSVFHSASRGRQTLNISLNYLSQLWSLFVSLHLSKTPVYPPQPLLPFQRWCWVPQTQNARNVFNALSLQFSPLSLFPSLLLSLSLSISLSLFLPLYLSLPAQHTQKLVCMSGTSINLDEGRFNQSIYAMVKQRQGDNLLIKHAQCEQQEG